jgi:hypothetical protein
MSLNAAELYAVKVHSMRDQEILTCELVAVIYKLHIKFYIGMDCYRWDGKLQK